MKKSKGNSGSIFKSRKLNIFLVFVLLAFLFSILTKLSKDYTQTMSLQIEVVNVPEANTIIMDSMNTLEVTLTTYGFKLIRYYFSRPLVEIDISNLDKDEEHYIWTERKEFSNVVSQFDPNVKIENINPDTLKLRYDTSAVKKVPVILDSDIQFSSGFDIVNSIVLEPDSVKVIGPGILIDSIGQVTTKKLILADVNGNIDTNVILEQPESEQIDLSDLIISVKANVEKFTEGSVDVPIIVKNVPDNIELKVYPKTVQVIYYASLSDFNTIAPNNFIVECDFNDALNAEVNYLVPKLVEKPEQVKEARLNIKRIEFILK